MLCCLLGVSYLIVFDRTRIVLLQGRLVKEATAVFSPYQHTAVGNRRHSVFAFLEQGVRLVLDGKSKPSICPTHGKENTHFLSGSAIRTASEMGSRKNLRSHQSQSKHILTVVRLVGAEHTLTRAGHAPNFIMSMSSTTIKLEIYFERVVTRATISWTDQQDTLP